MWRDQQEQRKKIAAWEVAAAGNGSKCLTGIQTREPSREPRLQGLPSPMAPESRYRSLELLGHTAGQRATYLEVSLFVLTAHFCFWQLDTHVSGVIFNIEFESDTTVHNRIKFAPDSQSTLW